MHPCASYFRSHEDAIHCLDIAHNGRDSRHCLERAFTIEKSLKLLFQAGGSPPPLKMWLDDQEALAASNQVQSHLSFCFLFSALFTSINTTKASYRPIH